MDVARGALTGVRSKTGEGVAAGTAGHGPPRLPFVLSVGVTGHRVEALSAEANAALPDRIRTALDLVTASARAIHARETDLFATSEARFDFVSALAGGADQIAAEAALGLGYSLSAVLPFACDEYRETLVENGDLGQFGELVERAERVLELPGQRADYVDAYVMVGRAIVAHSDLLIAIWDGQKARGPGGTGDVVQTAIERGTPVIHVPPEPSEPARLLWAAFDPVVDTQGVDPMAERSLDREHLDQVLGALMVPPHDEEERKYMALFVAERQGKIRWRIEYPLLLWLFRVKKFVAMRFVERVCAAEIADEWREYRSHFVDQHEIGTPLDKLEQAYSWADRLATRFAQTYRSGHIFNFVLGGIAVCLGLSGFMAPAHKFWLAAVEFAITLAILFNTHRGMKEDWHRRWLDYRQLAERLRAMRSLKLLGIAAPDPPGTRTYPVPERWVDWYAIATWRAMRSPVARITPERASQLAIAIADHEIGPQVGYHERNAQTIDKLDHRLDKVGTTLFFATLIVSIATLIGMAVGEAYVNTLGNWFTLVSAGFPALGTSIFGIRYQGDFGATAQRSQSTSRQLKAIDKELRKGPDLLRTSDLIEEASRVMLGDLDEWCLLNQQRELSI
jgi:hypothetical protein